MPDAAWGHWRRLYVDDRIELRVLETLAGGFSSPHTHRAKSNVFCVASGSLVLRMWTGPEDAFIECACSPESQPPSVPAGVRHQFASLTDAVVYELSVAVPGELMDPDEIERHGESGMKA